MSNIIKQNETVYVEDLDIGDEFLDKGKRYRKVYNHLPRTTMIRCWDCEANHVAFFANIKVVKVEGSNTLLHRIEMSMALMIKILRWQHDNAGIGGSYSDDLMEAMAVLEELKNLYQ